MNVRALNASDSGLHLHVLACWCGEQSCILGLRTLLDAASCRGGGTVGYGLYACALLVASLHVCVDNMWLLR
jgi:hypothetical protein